jgi:hypothetical protein
VLLVLAFLLAGERIQFDSDQQPHFTDKQIRETSEVTRGGLMMWAATETGRRLIRYFDRNEYEVVITEEPMQTVVGRAPHPGIATLLAGGDHSRLKSYDLILNPEFLLPNSYVNVVPSRQPGTPEGWMAAAWAGEMLHIYYYSLGISLPHHQRTDFQQEWHIMAAELGVPGMPHAEEEP